MNALSKADPSDSDNDAPHLRRIRSFVRREGRLTPGQQRALTSLLPQFGIPGGEQAIDSSALFGRQAPLTVEIGFGNGDTLLELARNHPERNYIGIEVHRPGVGRALLGIEADGLTNLRIYPDDAADFISQRLAPGSVDELLLYFPDPWHKKRHHKRRIVQTAFADRVAQLLRPGGCWYLATDWQNYAEHMLETLDDHPAFQNRAGKGGYLTDRTHRPESHFERRGLRKGHSVFDLAFERLPSTDGGLR